jgi:hypothetical protein
MRIDWQLLRFPFDDARWQNKALIGVLLSIGSMLLFPFSLVLALPLCGYGLRLMRRVIQGSEPSLPEWDNWGDLFTDGLKAWVVGFVYTLPILIMTCCLYGSFFVMIPLMAAADGGPEKAMALFGSMMLFYIVMFVGIALIILVAVPTLYFLTVALTRLATTGSLNSAFELGEVVRLGRKGFPNFALAFIGLYGTLGILYTAMIAIIYSIILSCLTPILMGVMMFYFTVLGGALFGKAYSHTVLTPALVEGALTPLPVATSPLEEKPKKPRAAPKKKKDAE